MAPQHAQIARTGGACLPQMLSVARGHDVTADDSRMGHPTGENDPQHSHQDLQVDEVDRSLWQDCAPR